MSEQLLRNAALKTIETHFYWDSNLSINRRVADIPGRKTRKNEDGSGEFNAVKVLLLVK
jgi:hypothetical protein